METQLADLSAQMGLSTENSRSQQSPTPSHCWSTPILGQAQPPSAQAHPSELLGPASRQVPASIWLISPGRCSQVGGRLRSRDVREFSKTGPLPTDWTSPNHPWGTLDCSGPREKASGGQYKMSGCPHFCGAKEGPRTKSRGEPHWLQSRPPSATLPAVTWSKVRGPRAMVPPGGHRRVRHQK